MEVSDEIEREQKENSARLFICFEDFERAPIFHATISKVDASGAQQEPKGTAQSSGIERHVQKPKKPSVSQRKLQAHTIRASHQQKRRKLMQFWAFSGARN
eukprot:GEMP01037917.1.p2 GENE.GEMP01037917.1~~GEMP01037917.1.p2  ORF type:complete len:101 (-),score=17.49 GEMP01037917.1:913-1215(-)